jgi:hypothetical protein
MASKGWTPGFVNMRRTDRASPLRGGVVVVVCGVCSIVLPPNDAAPQRLERL